MEEPIDGPQALSIAELVTDQAISILCNHGNVPGRLIVSKAALPGASMIEAKPAGAPEQETRLYGPFALLGTPTSKRAIVATSDEQAALDSLPPRMRTRCECTLNPLPKTARSSTRTPKKK